MSDSPQRPPLLEGATVIVTGSTRGIGAAIARRFADAGATVVVSGRSVEDGNQVVEQIEADGGDALFQRTDVSDPDDVGALVEATAEAFDGVDVLVNNAAFETDTTPDEIDLDTWEEVINTDFRSYWLAAKYAHPYLAESDRGAVVNVGSNHATATHPKKFPYNAVKAGIDGMTRAMATAWGTDGIRVNSVNPGWTAVDRITESLSEADREHLARIHPLGRIGTPEEVAETALFLACDMASFVTGACLVADGGRTAVLQDGLYVGDVEPSADDLAEPSGENEPDTE